MITFGWAVSLILINVVLIAAVVLCFASGAVDIAAVLIIGGLILDSILGKMALHFSKER